MRASFPVVGLVVVSIALLPAVALPQPRPQGLTGDVTAYVVVRGDTLTGIGGRFGVGLEAIVADNALAPDGVLREGQTLRIDHRHVVPAGRDGEALVINLPQRMLFYLAGDVPVAFPVAAGRRTWQTPVGPFTIDSRRENPAWHVPASILAEARQQGRELPPVVPPGPGNPLGRHWLGLSVPGYGIHGTNAPSSIHQLVTHGCIRLHPDDIAWLYPRLAIGTSGRIVYEPVLLAVVGDEVFLERHRDAYGLGGDPLAEARRLAITAGVSDRIDWAAAARVLAQQHGVARPVSVASAVIGTAAF
jgi:L,D-transpeptidase ErfK/SrfK